MLANNLANLISVLHMLEDIICERHPLHYQVGFCEDLLQDMLHLLSLCGPMCLVCS